MLIISKNKDFYDGVAGSMGIDKTIIFERNIEEIIDTKLMLEEFQPSNNRGWRGNKRDNSFLNLCYLDVDTKKQKKYVERSFFIIGFCGKLYLGWKFYYSEDNMSKKFDGFQTDLKSDIVYGYENAKNYLKDNYWRSNIDEDVNYVINYDPINMFRKLHAPIFVYDTHGRKNKLIVNAILKDYEFYKIFDSFQAFQEIQMFIGGVLGNKERDIIEVADKYKITGHGFDYKWSFRKEKENGK